MANCILCSASLGMLNRPTFGQGKLLDGTEICFKCFTKHGGVKAGFKGMTHTELIDKINNPVTEVTLTPELSDVEKKIKEISAQSGNSFFGRKEVKELPKILHQGEDLIDFIIGIYNDRTGLLALTSKRLIFMDKGLMSLKVEDFPLNVISSIQYETNFINGKITIMASGNNAVIAGVRKDKVAAFVDKTRRLISEQNSIKNQPQQVVINQGVDVADQLAKLADLKAKGILTDEEFQQQKQKLLNL